MIRISKTSFFITFFSGQPQCYLIIISIFAISKASFLCYHYLEFLCLGKRDLLSMDIFCKILISVDTHLQIMKFQPSITDDSVAHAYKKACTSSSFQSLEKWKRKNVTFNKSSKLSFFLSVLILVISEVTPKHFHHCSHFRDFVQKFHEFRADYFAVWLDITIQILMDEIFVSFCKKMSFAWYEWLQFRFLGENSSSWLSVGAIHDGSSCPVEKFWLASSLTLSAASPFPWLTFPFLFITYLIMSYTLFTSVASLWFWSLSFAWTFSYVISFDAISFSNILIYSSLLIDFAKSVLCASLILKLVVDAFLCLSIRYKTLRLFPSWLLQFW